MYLNHSTSWRQIWKIPNQSEDTPSLHSVTTIDISKVCHCLLQALDCLMFPNSLTISPCLRVRQWVCGLAKSVSLHDREGKGLSSCTGGQPEVYLLRFLVCFGDSVINHVLGRAAATAAIERRRRVLPGRPAVRTISAQPPRQTFLLPPSTRPVWIQWISGTLLPTSTAVLPSSEYSSWHFHFSSDVFS